MKILAVALMCLCCARFGHSEERSGLYNSYQYPDYASNMGFNPSPFLQNMYPGGSSDSLYSGTYGGYSVCQGVNCGYGRYCEPLTYTMSSGKSYRCRRYGDDNNNMNGMYPGGGMGINSVYPGGMGQGNGMYPGGSTMWGTNGIYGASSVMGGQTVMPGYPSIIGGGGLTTIGGGGMGTPLMPGGMGGGAFGGSIYRPVTKCFDELVYKVPAGSMNDGRTRLGMPGMGTCPNQCFRSNECGAGQICCSNGCGNVCYTPETTVIDSANTNPGMQTPFAGGNGLGGMPIIYRGVQPGMRMGTLPVNATA